MGRINIANLKKTIYYLQRNGLKSTWYAAKERLEERKAAPYVFVPVSRAELERQRNLAEAFNTTFSIVVPTYHTDKVYLQEMIQSVVSQSYPRWELILADATGDDSVKVEIDKITCDIEEQTAKKIKYTKLEKNAGIAENTNQALLHVNAEYVGLLDHDDVLTPDALYEMVTSIEEGKRQGIDKLMLYSDEDKCNGEMTRFYEPNRKEDFNLDLLLSNNYICHFLVMKTELIRELQFRSQYDGAQDYDLVLRAAAAIRKRYNTDKEVHWTQHIVHIPKVLYHWRCHTGSTAENPQSKQYACDAGERALQDYADREGYAAKAVSLKHLGFYALQYEKDIFEVRKELGLVGGSVFEKNTMGTFKLIGGRMTADGEVFYEGIQEGYSGYLHRAVLTQDAEAVDIRCIRVCPECRGIFEEITSVTYKEVQNKTKEKIKQDFIFDTSTLPDDMDYKEVSLRLSKAVREAGYEVMYSPFLIKYWKGERKS